MLAAREGSGETVAAILKFRPKIAQRNATGDSALMLAALKGHATSSISSWLPARRQ